MDKYPVHFEDKSFPDSRLNALLAEVDEALLTVEQLRRFEDYLSLFIRWNSRMNLSSVRDPDGILARHFVESIACARALPARIKTLLDFGSGGGLPGIPIALCRPEISVTLAESQGKKAAFLREVVRTLGITVTVFAGRAETLTERFDCVVLRAVDKMSDAVHSAVKLVASGGYLGLMTTHGDVERLQAACGMECSWSEFLPLPGNSDRILALGRLTISSSA